ncbi:MAG TPA: zinc ABC transporter substrate-binding protein, partial [Chloroflexia bacterium]|nr:zinc ABC transporter substrate-binding protein [Chloroflexia bacterium]
MKPVVRRSGLPALLIAVLLAAVLAGCRQAPPSSIDTSTPVPGTLRVTVTTTQIRALTEAVAGRHAAVSSMLPPDVDPHEYNPKPSDVQMITGAQVILTHGM